MEQDRHIENKKLIHTLITLDVVLSGFSREIEPIGSVCVLVYKWFFIRKWIVQLWGLAKPNLQCGPAGLSPRSPVVQCQCEGQQFGDPGESMVQRKSEESLLESSFIQDFN